MGANAKLFYMVSGENKDEATISLPLFQGEAHACPYLPGLTARDEFIHAARLNSRIYQEMMDHGFRRSGRAIYRPACDGCRMCVPLRVPVSRFRPSRSQRRVLRRNSDVSVETQSPSCTDEKWKIYVAYLRFQHDGAMSERREDFEQFLYDSPTETVEMVYRESGRVMGVGIVDRCPDCLSSVYFYFDPNEARRSLGVFSTLMELSACWEWNLPYWYAGYYVRDCGRMSYKANFQPYELLGADGKWRAGGA